MRRVGIVTRAVRVGSLGVLVGAWGCAPTPERVAATWAEDCSDGVDNDGNGAADCADSQCAQSCPEDCSDGVDNNANGLVDCEDAACLDACLEDCADGVDNDGDGAVDCDDDECIGGAECASVGTHQVESYIYFDTFSWHIYSDTPWRVETYFQGTITVVGTPIAGGEGSFACDGTLQGDSRPDGGLGVSYLGTNDTGYLFGFGPNVVDHSLTWFGPCPVRGLPSRTLGTYRLQYGLYNATEEPWVLQYHPADYEAYANGPGDVHHHLGDFTQTESRFWTVNYPGWAP